MQKTVVIFLSLVIGLIGCQKKENLKESQKLQYESAIPFVHEKIADVAQAASIDDSPVSWSQLLSQDPALQELQEKYNQSIYSFTYAWAKSLSEKGETPINVTLNSLKPQTELKTILKNANVEEVDKVTVEFSEVENYELLAQAGENKLSWQDYLASNVVHAKLYDALYKQRMQRLNGIVVRRYLLEASKAAQIPMEDFVKSKIVTEEVNPNEADVFAFAKQRGIAETDIDEKMMDSLKQIIKQNDRDKKIENYVAKNLIKSPIKVTYKNPSFKVVAPQLNDSIPQWGDKGPELYFVGDWSCEECSPLMQSFLEAKNQWGQKLHGALIFSFPERDREARMGAEAAFCVKAQKQEAVWTFLSEVLKLNEENFEEKINQAVKSSGVDFALFRECFLKREYQATVDTHLTYAKNMGITKSPLLVLQGQVLEPPFNTQTIASTYKDMGISLGGSSFFSRILAWFGL